MANPGIGPNLTGNGFSTWPGCTLRMIVLLFWMVAAGLIVGAWTALLGRRSGVALGGLGVMIICFAGLCLLLGLPFAALAEMVLVGGGIGSLFFSAERWLGKGILTRGTIHWSLLLGLLLLTLGAGLVCLRLVTPTDPSSPGPASSSAHLPNRLVFQQPARITAPSDSPSVPPASAWITPALWVPLELIGLVGALVAGAFWNVRRSPAAVVESTPPEIEI